MRSFYGYSLLGWGCLILIAAWMLDWFDLDFIRNFFPPVKMP